LSKAGVLDRIDMGAIKRLPPPCRCASQAEANTPNGGDIQRHGSVRPAPGRAARYHQTIARPRRTFLPRRKGARQTILPALQRSLRRSRAWRDYSVLDQKTCAQNSRFSEHGFQPVRHGPHRRWFLRTVDASRTRAAAAPRCSAERRSSACGRCRAGFRAVPGGNLVKVPRSSTGTAPRANRKLGDTQGHVRQGSGPRRLRRPSLSKTL